MSEDSRRAENRLVRLLAIAVPFAAAGFALLMFQAGLGLGVRLLGAAGSLMVLSVPVRIGFVALRRKRRTGQWSIAEEERTRLLRRPGEPMKPWIFPMVTACLMLFALVNAAAQASHELRGKGSVLDGILLVFWIAFFAMEAVQLLVHTRQTGVPRR